MNTLKNPTTQVDGSNRLPVLATLVREAHDLVRDHERAAAEKAFAAGEMLIEAKALCRHGEWAAWLKEAGIPDRSAQRYMLLPRVGVKSDTLSYFGLAEAYRLAAKGLRLFPQPNHLKIGSGQTADGGGFIYWIWRLSDDVGRYGFLNTRLQRITDSRPAFIFGLALIHDHLTRGAPHIDNPTEVSYSAAPEDVALLTEFDSLAGA